jgi:hypothetical protein
MSLGMVYIFSSYLDQNGLFVTPYIIQTLAVHHAFGYNDMKIDVPDADNRPQGALMLVLAAVCLIILSS